MSSRRRRSTPPVRDGVRVAMAVNGAVHVVQLRRSLRGTVGLALRESVNAAVRMTTAVGMRVAAVPVRMGVTRVCCLCETAQRHDAKTNTAERQSERVGVHDWVSARPTTKKGVTRTAKSGDRVTPCR